MCKASIVAAKKRDGQTGEKGLTIGSSYHGLGALHDIGTSSFECVVCVQTGAKMTLTDIPSELQQILGIGADEDVTFIQTPGSDEYVIHDLLKFDDHPNLKPVPFAVFADLGIGTEISRAPSKPLAIEDVLAEKPTDWLTGQDPMVMARRVSEESRIAA